MTSRFLRKFRVIFASVTLLALTAVFVDYRHLIPPEWVTGIVFLQFTPSFLKFMNLPVIAASGFIIVLALTVFSGRSYCSFLCPLGIFQDVVNRLGGKFKKRNRKFRYEKPYTILRYSVLALTLLVLLAGSVSLVSLLDPYSIFGRIMTYFSKPVVVQGNNLVARILTSFDIYAVYKVQLKTINAAVYVLPAAFLFLIGYLSFKNGRLYCNTVCPVGTFLGLISKVSLFGIKIDSNSCTRCGRCAVACKSSCIDFLNESVDISRCVSCFNCIDSCNDNAILFGMRKSPAKVVTVADDSIDKSKRNFIFSALALGTIAASTVKGQDQDTIKIPVPKKLSTIPEDRTSPVCPPGGISIEHFNDYCIACSLCVTACPTSVIRPSFREYGLAGIMQPRMDYHTGFCNFECTVCIDVCPSGALLPLVLEAKKLTQLGKAKFIEDNCIVKTEKTDCGACSEHCPTKAVKMVHYEGNLVIPEVTDDICIGCGACEYACPVKPYKAIFVNGNPVHLDAKKPPEEKSEIKELEAFPF